MSTLLWRLSCVTLAVSLTISAEVLATESKPLPFQHVPERAITKLDAIKFNSAPASSNKVVKAAEPTFNLPLEEGNYAVSITHQVTHDNGDITTWGRFWQNGKPYQVILTQGKAGAIGEINGASGKRLILQQQGQLYLLDMSKVGFSSGNFADDVITPEQTGTNSVKPRQKASKMSTMTYQNQEYVIVDIMMLYDEIIAQQYPDGLAETLMTQLVAKANQAFVDSAINVQLRLVHRQYVAYTEPSNLDALYELRVALGMQDIWQPSPPESLREIASLREQYGADLVAMIRTHELNERETCGIALLPNVNSDILVNISNVGISGGSNCADTFTHEIGHNFGAGHQFSGGRSDGATATAGAFVVPGKFNTVMSSFGTGNSERDLTLSRFSNPATNCAQQQCGDELTADNASAITHFALQNANLRASMVDGTVVPPPISDPDSDGDSVTDLYDAFPFNASESADTDNDGVGNNADVFPYDATESADFDGDGVGNNADTDDDNDGIADELDALPFVVTETVDSDGDGVGDNRDELPNNYQDFNNADGDGLGDRFDSDNDNDGVEDFDSRSSGKQQLVVISAGTDSIIALDTENSAQVETIYQGEVGGFSFRSDLVEFGAGQLAFIQFSDVKRLDRRTNIVDTLIPRYYLNSNFAAHLLSIGESQSERRLFISNGLGTSYLQAYIFLDWGTIQDFYLESEAVYRDILNLNSSQQLVVERDSNTILVYDITSVEPEFGLTVWSSEGLDKPEHLLRVNDRILVTNAGSKNISQYSLTGTYLGEFISAGAGGLGMPSCIAADNNGDVYVCSLDTHQILKFSGENGRPLGEVMNAEMGLDSPVSMAFVGAILDEAPFDPMNDTDKDGVANAQDAFPLDPSRTSAINPEPQPSASSGGALSFWLWALLVFANLRRFNLKRLSAVIRQY